MSTYYYSKTHECFHLEDGEAVVSITPYAVEQLGEVTYVQLPEVGKHFAQGESFGEVESVKTVSELYAPLSGTVKAVNSSLEDAPEQLNADPLSQGWLIRLSADKLEELDGCLDQAAYQAYLDQLA